MDLNNVCRICLENTELYPIFNYRRHTENHMLYENLSLKITECSNIKIYQNDGLPDKICKACLDLLMTAYKFKLLSEKSDEKIKNIMHSNFIELKSRDDVKSLSEKLCVNELSQLEIKKQLSDGNEHAIEVDEPIFQISVVQNNIRNDSDKISTIELSINNLDTENVFYCHKCTKKFPDKSFLKEHVSKVHSDKKKNSFTCYNCDRVFQSNWNRSIHEKRCLMAAGVLYECSVCSNTFDDRKSFSNHMKKHLAIKLIEKESFKCDQCPKIFTNKRNLKAHQLLHLAIKKFVCEICGRLFARQDYLAKHLRAHHHDYPYACSVVSCNYVSVQRNSLVSHMRTHTKEKPFHCTECNHSSATSGNLSSHIKAVHRETELFKCQLCTQAFKRKYNLKEHISIEHCGFKPICTYCEKVFNSEKNLDRHLKSQHQKKIT